MTTAPQVTLRTLTEDDLPKLFEHQRDHEAHRMIGFHTRDPDDREAFNLRWTDLIHKTDIILQGVLAQGKLAGYFVLFYRDLDAEIGYWIGRTFAGQGIATAGLRLFLQKCSPRPIHARVAFDNIASQRVLLKCGFRLSHKETAFAPARGEDLTEHIMMLH